MVLQARPIAFTVAIVGFFALSIVSSLGGLPPETCCERALLGAVAAYVAALAALRAINMILTQAMIASQVDKEKTGDNKD